MKTTRPAPGAMTFPRCVPEGGWLRHAAIAFSVLPVLLLVAMVVLLITQLKEPGSAVGTRPVRQRRRLAGMPHTDPFVGRPPGGPRPPAPPDTGEPGPYPDPADPGPPIPVQLGPVLLGDLGNPAVDARLLSALVLRGGRVGQWLQAQGVDLDGIHNSFPDSEW
jgi:hypothetical protein